MMTPEQRVLRRKLRQMKARDDRLARRKESIFQGYGEPESQKCNGTTLIGTPCENWCVHGEDKCVSHVRKEVRDALSPSVRGPKRKAPEMMREVAEVAAAAIIKPYLDALGLTFEGYDEETGEPVVTANGGGLVLHGESKEGEIVMTDYADVLGRVGVAEKFNDRVYGKPRQTTVLEGGVQPIKVVPVKSEERAQAVAELLARSGALPGQAAPSDPPHEGRQRRAPASPTDRESVPSGDES